MMTPLIQVEHVSFSYQEQVVLEDVSFDIQSGEFIGLIGPNGSGKTTLLKIVLGLLKPQHGSVKILGKSVQVGQYTQLGYIPQKMTQLETRFPITVEEVVSLGRVDRRHLFHQLNGQDYQAVTEALHAVNLNEYRQRLITDLSGGQQQRAFIAKALAGNPKLLILDEPTVGIDTQSQEVFYTLLAELNKKRGLTIIIVSHDIDVVMNEVNSVLCLNKNLIYHGNPKEFVQEKILEQTYGKNRKYVIHGH